MRLVPLHVVESLAARPRRLRAAVSDRTRVVFFNNASFPTGWVASDAEWDAVVNLPQRMSGFSTGVD